MPDAPHRPAAAPPSPPRAAAPGFLDGPDGPAQDEPSSSTPWLEIGALREQPVLLDPAGTYGLGLTGPTATDIARAVLVDLLDTGHPVTIATTTDTAHQLLDLDTPPTNTNPDEAPLLDYGDRLRTFDHPHAALDAARVEIHRRHTTSPTSGGGSEVAGLWVLVLPAPEHPSARARLHHALQDGAPHGITAILLGTWPTGISAHLDSDARVTGHTTPHPGQHAGSWPITPTQLLDAQLYTSTPHDLHNALLDALDADTYSDHHDNDHDHDDNDDNHESELQHDQHDHEDQPHDANQQRDRGAAAASATGSANHDTGPDDLGEVDQPATGDQDPHPRSDQDVSPGTSSESSGNRESPEPVSPTPAAAPGNRDNYRDNDELAGGADGRTAAGAGPGEHEAAGGPGSPVSEPWRPFQLAVLGPTALTYNPHPNRSRYGDPSTAAEPVERPVEGPIGEPVGEPVAGIGPRVTALLTYLACHPNGVHRDTLVAALWPNTPTRRPTNSLNALLTRLRKLLRALPPPTPTPRTPRPGTARESAQTGSVQPGDGAPTGTPRVDLGDLIIRVGERYQLNSDLVTVDYWTFLVAARHITDPDPHTRAAACEAVITTYTGPLGATQPHEWLITLREATRRRYLDALTTLAMLIVTTDPLRTLGLLETARNHEPLNEAIYRDIMRVQARLGRHDAAAHTLTLLRAQLADIGETPEPATLELAAHIANQR